MTQLELWLNEAKSNKELDKALKAQTKEERAEAFNGDLTFGTGGIRGVMGYGTNRLNIYTLRKANYGLGNYLLKEFKSEISKGVVISHDNRMNSRNFAFESAKVLGAMGIKCFMFDDLRTTPELSFAVRFLGCISGIMITASHNPAKYNGYKIYDSTGCQYTPEYADKVIEEVNKVENVFEIPTLDIETMTKMGLFQILNNEVDDAFVDMAKSVQIYPDMDKNIKIVYSPLHGTGAEAAERVLTECGYDVSYVKEQMIHDPQFPTVTLPNPEDPKAFVLAEKLGNEVNADLLVATDPDADRVGIGVKTNEGYKYLTGNQTGALMIYYRLSQLKKLGLLPAKGKVFNTIVTSELGAKIALSFGYPTFSTLTGFKFIGEQCNLLESTDEVCVFGYEESYGYIIKDYVRDKDSIQSLLAICEMCNYYKETENKNLVEVLEEVYKEYGYYKEYTSNLFFEGLDGNDKMKKITSYFRNTEINEIASIKVLAKEDYLLSERYANGSVSPLTLPKSDVIKYFLEGGSWAVIRPSGTEPKLKIYYSCKNNSMESASETVDQINNYFQAKVKEIVG